MTSVPFPTLYPITDTRVSGLSHAEQIRRLVDGGATIIQLREKHEGPREFFDDARAAIEIARSQGARIIINDRVDIAMALDADGVHLGQDDLPAEVARRLLGSVKIIGYSTHDVAQAREAANLPIDYIAIGPIFLTTNKANPHPVVGLEGLRRVRDAIGDLTLVAIGGITVMNAPEVLAAGADSVAVIGAILSDPAGIEAATRAFFSPNSQVPGPKSQVTGDK